MTPRRPFAAVLLLAAGLSGCGKATSEPEAPPAAKPVAPAPAFDPRTEPAEITVAHVLFTHKDAAGSSKAGRTKEQALKLAESVIKDLEGGRPFEEVVVLTDDLQWNGQPNPPGGPPGTYTLSRTGNFVPEFIQGGFATPVGKVAPKPVETLYGYHVMKRIK